MLGVLMEALSAATISYFVWNLIHHGRYEWAGAMGTFWILFKLERVLGAIERRK